MPWQYPPSLCETLCRGCHAAEHGKIPPLVGWELVGVNDLEDLVGTCEYCSTAIRYAYLIQHPRWIPLEVGSECCDNLTATTLASNHRESIVRQAKRRRAFVKSPRWCVPYPPLHTIEQRTKGGTIVDVEVLHDGAGGYRVNMYGKRGKRLFSSLLEAKCEAFDLLDSGKIDAWIAKGAPRRATSARPAAPSSGDRVAATRCPAAR